MKIYELVREDLKDLMPYEPHPFSNTIKLDANENPHPFPAEVLSEIFSRISGDDFTRYPDPLGENLRGKIAVNCGMRPENIILGNGSDELILLLLQTFGGPGKRVIIPTPTFSMYRIHGQISGTQAVEVPRDEKFGLQLDEMLAEMNHPGARLTFIATPNNPTGNVVSPGQIRSLTEKADSLVVVDEAYIDFGGESCMSLLRDFPNLVILRTFSKVALAGLRIGYLVANVEVTRELLKVKQPYNVNAFSQTAASVVLDHWPSFQEQINEIVCERNRLSAELSALEGILVYPSEANFLLFKAPGADQLHRALLAEGILVRGKPGHSHGLQDCLRVTVGTKQENDLFIEKMRKILSH